MEYSHVIRRILLSIFSCGHAGIASKYEQTIRKSILMAETVAECIAGYQEDQYGNALPFLDELFTDAEGKGFLLWESQSNRQKQNCY